ncbi:MAG: ABC transporter substrate-binding protein [Methylococcales bacterium]
MLNFAATGRKRIAIRCLLLLALFMASARAVVPQRVVSINLCTDQLLVLLAQRDRIQSLSYLAANPEVSPVAELAAGIVENYGSAEEVLNFNPDLVLASVFGAHSTNAILKRLGIRLVEIPVARNIQEIRESIRTVAAAIGSPASGEALLKKFDRDLQAASLSPARVSAHPSDRFDLEGSPLRAARNAVAALFRENNVVYGSGTISGVFVKAAGMDNLADKLDHSAFSYMPLEILIEQKPDVIVQAQGTLRAARGILAYESLHHPAMQNLLEKSRLVRIPDSLWSCGSPAIVDAIAKLAAAHRQWREERKPRSLVDDAR